jgi:NAD(P)H dehydrogenase (quinone)
MIEAYIKQSGIPWTFLHPNVFMQNLTGLFALVKNGKVRWWCGDKPCGWIALEDVADAAAKILTEGEKVHSFEGILVLHRKSYAYRRRPHFERSRGAPHQG